MLKKKRSKFRFVFKWYMNPGLSDESPACNPFSHCKLLPITHMGKIHPQGQNWPLGHLNVAHNVLKEK